MLPASLTYKNALGVDFEIVIGHLANVPTDANYWGFSFRVREAAGVKGRTFRALLKKDSFPSQSGAAQFLSGDPLNY